MSHKRPVRYFVLLALLLFAIPVSGAAGRFSVRRSQTGGGEAASGAARVSSAAGTVSSAETSAAGQTETAGTVPVQTQQSLPEPAVEKSTAASVPKQESPVAPAPKQASAAAAQTASAGGSDTAVELFSGLPQKDTLRSADDVRYYRFRADARGSLRYSVTAAQKADLTSRIVSLYQVYYLNGTDGEKGVRLLNYLQAYTTETVNESPAVGIIPGEYLLAVQAGPYADLSAYEIALTFTPGTDYEIEYNDSPSRYTELFSGVTAKGSASGRRTGTDLDWFMIRMHQPGALSLQFAHAANDLLTAAFRVTVYTQDMEEIYSGVSAQNLALLESGEIGVPAGAYFICVEARVSFTGDYALTVTKTAADLFEKELNDTRETASLLRSGRPVTGVLSPRQNAPDTDWYKIELPADGLLTLTLSAEPEQPGKNDEAKYCRRVTLTDAAGRTLWRGLMLQTDGTLSTGALGLGAGVCYVQVDHNDLYASAARYTVQYTFTASNACETEYNDTLLLASGLTPGSPCVAALQERGAGPDTDWFRFSLKKTAEVTLEITHENGGDADALYRAALYNAAGVVLADTAGNEALVCSGDTAASRCGYRLPAGTYFVQVSAGVYARHDAYAVNIIINDP